jgi:hypothetical protein
VFVAICERLKSSVCMLANLVAFEHDVTHLSNIISDVVLIGINCCASVLLYEFILSSEFNMA